MWLLIGGKKQGVGAVKVPEDLVILDLLECRLDLVKEDSIHCLGRNLISRRLLVAVASLGGHPDGHPEAKHTKTSLESGGG